MPRLHFLETLNAGLANLVSSSYYLNVVYNVYSLLGKLNSLLHLKTVKEENSMFRKGANPV